MNAKRCDRCKKYYDKNSKNETVGRIHGGVIEGIVTYTTGSNLDKYFDLCDDCIDDLKEWLKGVVRNETN